VQQAGTAGIAAAVVRAREDIPRLGVPIRRPLGLQQAQLQRREAPALAQVEIEVARGFQPLARAPSVRWRSPA